VSGARMEIADLDKYRWKLAHVIATLSGIAN
jgi:hypothetical protein